MQGNTDQESSDNSASSELFSASASVLFEALLMQTQDQVYFKDRRSRFIKCSDKMAKKFNVDSVRDLYGKTDFDFFTHEHAQQAYDDEQQLMQRNEKLINKVEKETWPDGSISWVNSTKIPLYLGSGKLVGLMGISRDITDEVEARLALEESREQLKRKNDIMETDFENARLVQRKLIPGPIPDMPFAEVAVLSRSMTEVGGDVVTFPNTRENQFSFLLGDVSGHGVSAGLFTILVKHLADFYMPDDLEHPEVALMKLDEHLKGLIPAGFVATMVGNVAPGPDGGAVLNMANAGQPPALMHRKSSGRAEIIDVTSENVIGLGICTNLEAKEIRVERGDTLLFFTDAANECRSPAGEELGMEGFRVMFEACAEKPLNALMKELEERLEAFAEGDYPQDDATFLLIRIK